MNPNEFGQPIQSFNPPQEFPGYNNPYAGLRENIFQEHFNEQSMALSYDSGFSDANLQFTGIMQNTQQMLNGASNLMMQISADRERDKQVVLTTIQKNNMLQATICNMKKDRTEHERAFWYDPADVIWCNDTNDTKKMVGKIKILKIAKYKFIYSDFYEDYISVTYADSKNEQRIAMITVEELTKKNLISNFIGFEYVCKNRQLANDGLAYMINRLTPTSSHIVNEYAGFAPYHEENTCEKAKFVCNDGTEPVEVMMYYPQNILDRTLPVTKHELNVIQEKLRSYVNTPEKAVLFTYGICGLLSSLLDEIGHPISEYLVIDSPDYTGTKLASMYMNLYNRSSEPLSFDSNITHLRKVIQTSNDETVIIADCINIDNQNKRNSVIPQIMAIDAESSVHHNMAIISSAAQYMIPEEKKICLSLDESFYSDITDTADFCVTLNDAVRHFIYVVCNAYDDIKSLIMEGISEYSDYGFTDDNSATTKNSIKVMTAVYDMIDLIFRFDIDKTSVFKYFNALPSKQTGGNAEAVATNFTDQFNQAIRDGKMQFTHYSLKEQKPDDFIRNNNQLLIDGNTLAVETSTFENVVLPNMNTTNSLNCILKSLAEDGLLQKYSNGTKETYTKKRTVSENGSKSRIPFIELSITDILDNDLESMAYECKYADWFSSKPDTAQFLPVITNMAGNTAGQIVAQNKDSNLHYFAAGISGSGKTHSLTERMVSIQKAGFQSVVFDTSDSFNKTDMIEHLAAGGDEKVRCEVEQYVEEHFTFIKIEEDGIPVEPFLFNCDNIKEVISSIVMSHHTCLIGNVQTAILNKKLQTFIESNDYSTFNLFDKIAGCEYPKNHIALKLQLQDNLSCFANYECNDITWKELLNQSKDIIVISMNPSSKLGGYALIDMLMMSLFYYQRLDKATKLSIFIDEIQNQNLKPNGPITQILREGRKFHTSLNYATQTESLSNKDISAVIKQAGLLVYFRPDDISISAVSKSIGVEKEKLSYLNTGECYLKGEVYNHKKGIVETRVLQGSTYRNFIPFPSKA